MILDKYGAAKVIPIALRSTGATFDEVELKTSEIQNDKNRGSTVQVRVEGRPGFGRNPAFFTPSCCFN
jgi:hypothetical protein